jgi:hypothetical protein
MKYLADIKLQNYGTLACTYKCYSSVGKHLSRTAITRCHLIQKPPPHRTRTHTPHSVTFGALTNWGHERVRVGSNAGMAVIWEGMQSPAFCQDRLRKTAKSVVRNNRRPGQHSTWEPPGPKNEALPAESPCSVRPQTSLIQGQQTRRKGDPTSRFSDRGT